MQHTTTCVLERLHELRRMKESTGLSTQLFATNCLPASDVITEDLRHSILAPVGHVRHTPLRCQTTLKVVGWAGTQNQAHKSVITVGLHHPSNFPQKQTTTHAEWQ